MTPNPNGLGGGETADAAEGEEDSLPCGATEDDTCQRDQQVRQDARARVGQPAGHGQGHGRAVVRGPGVEVLVAEERGTVPTGHDQRQQHEGDQAADRDRAREGPMRPHVS